MERVLTPEGQKLWDSIGSYTNAFNPPKSPEPPIPFDFWKLKFEAIVTEIMKLKKNSEMVVRDCNKIIKSKTTMEEYVKCDAKVAKTVHENAIKRYDRLLQGLSAFEYEINLDQVIILE